jgi:hypothetical protein
MGLGGIDHVVAAIDPVADKLLDQVGRMLTIAVHEQDRAAPGMVQSCHQRGFLAEIARQRHHLNVNGVGAKSARNTERGVGAAVIDIDNLAGQAVALPQRFCHFTKPRVQQCQPGRLVIKRYDDRQPLPRSRRRSGR